MYTLHSTAARGVELRGFADSFTTKWTYEVLADAFFNLHCFKKFVISHRCKGGSVASIHEKNEKPQKWSYEVLARQQQYVE